MLCSFLTLMLHQVSGQVIAWELSGLSGSTAGPVNSSTSATGVGTGSLSRGDGLSTGSATGAFNSSGWYTGTTVTTLANAIAGDDYYQFTVPITGGTATLTGVSFYLQASNTGPGTVALRSSVDSYASDLGTASVPTSSALRTITFSSALTNVSGTVTFRLYGYGTTANPTSTPGAGGTMRIGSSPTASAADIEVSGTVTPAAVPTILPTPGNLTFSYPEGSGPSSEKTFSATGSNLTGDVTASASANYEISLASGAGFGPSVTLSPTDGTLGATTVYVRLQAGLSLNSYPGTVSFSGGGLTTPPAVSLSGSVTVSSCGANATIASVRSGIPAQNSYAGSPGATVEGNVTAIFGANKFYVQDATGGIAVFATGVVSTNALALGDVVQLTGTPVRFNGEAQLNTLTCVVRKSGGTVPTPVEYTSAAASLNTFLSTYEGSLVKIPRINFNATGTFAGNRNYIFNTCDGESAEVRVDAQATSLIGSTIPTTTQDGTGVVGHFINASASTDILQLFPRTPADLTPTAGTACANPGGGDNPAACLPGGLESEFGKTLKLATWNIEWFGSTAEDPSNDALQAQKALQVIKQLNADVYYTIEVSNAAAFNNLVTALNDPTTGGAGKPYAGQCSGETSSNDPNGQRPCFIYRTDVVKNPTFRPLLKTIKDNPALMGQNGIPAYPNVASRFWASGRLPYLMQGDVMVNGVTRRMGFVAIHGRSEIAAIGTDKYDMRKYDAKALRDSLVAQFPTLPLVIGGDFNDDLDRSITFSGGQYLPTSYSDFTTDDANFNELTLNLSVSRCKTTSFPDIIDHFIASNEVPVSGTGGLRYLDASSGVENVTGIFTLNDGTTSDHYPVSTRVLFTAPTLSASPVSLMQGQNLTSVTVGSVSNPTDDATVTVSTTTNGVSVTNVQLSNGLVTADVSATCNATDASFTLTMTYGVTPTTATLNVDVTTEKPTVSATASPNPVCEGAVLNLQASATGTGTYTYAWSGPNDFLAAGNPAIRTVGKTDGGVYEITVTYGSNCTVSVSTASVVVTPGGFDGTPTVEGAPVCAGQAVTLSFGFTCPASYTFTARLSDANGSFSPGTLLGTVTPGSNGLTIPSGMPTGTGYRIQVVASDPSLTPVVSAAFRVNALGAVAVALYPATPGKICQGDPLPVTFTTTGTCPFPLDNVFTVQVSNASGSFANPTVLGTAQPGTTPFPASALSGLPAGRGYRVRIVSSNPASVSSASSPFELKAPSLAVTPGVAGVPACAGSEVTVSLNLPTDNCAFPEGNTFTAQLSNASGSFGSPVSLGSITPGELTRLTLPGNLPAGTGYRLRIVSSSPVLTSNASIPFRVNACNGRLSAEAPALTVAPNPVHHGTIRCRVTGLDAPRFNLTNAVGRSLPLQASPGDEPGAYVLRSQPLPSGVYVLQATEGPRQLHQRVIIVE